MESDHSLPLPLFRLDEECRGDELSPVMDTWGEVKHGRCENLDQTCRQIREEHRWKRKR